ncbi:g11486 [Coccomyxa elongata]
MSLGTVLRAIYARTLLQNARFVSTTPCARGLEDFFDTPVKEGEKVTAGRAWKAADLRLKSWDDLHKLWYVLLKERNMLKSEKDNYRARGLVMPNGRRQTKIQKSMCRIKYVMYERARTEKDPVKAEQLKHFVNNL